MAKAGSRTYAWIAAVYFLIGGYCISRQYAAFGMMWVFMGSGALAEYVNETKPAKWLSVAKWTSITLGLAMAAAWIVKWH